MSRAGYETSMPKAECFGSRKRDALRKRPFATGFWMAR